MPGVSYTAIDEFAKDLYRAIWNAVNNGVPVTYIAHTLSMSVSDVEKVLAKETERRNAITPSTSQDQISDTSKPHGSTTTGRHS